MSDFKNLVQVCEYFKDKETCHSYLAAVRWKDGITCPHCATSNICRFKDGIRYECNECSKQFNALTLTIFENTKIPLQKWFAALWLLSSHKKGISSHQTARDLQVTQKTAWFMMHRLRLMFAGGTISFMQNTVEADETFVGGRANKKKKGKKAKFVGSGADNKFVVMGIVERNNGLRLTHVPELMGYPKQIINEQVVKGSTIYTDEYNGYKKLSDEGYKHASVNHSSEQYAVGNVHTNTIEGAFSLFKRGYIGTYHYMSYKHLQRYCDEFSFRYSTRKQGEVERFNHALTFCVERMRYQELIGVPLVKKVERLKEVIKEDKKKMAKMAYVKQNTRTKRNAIAQRIKDGYKLPNLRKPLK